jgi:hypothetical protein
MTIFELFVLTYSFAFLAFVLVLVEERIFNRD